MDCLVRALQHKLNESLFARLVAGSLQAGAGLASFQVELLTKYFHVLVAAWICVEIALLIEKERGCRKHTSVFGQQAMVYNTGVARKLRRQGLTQENCHGVKCLLLQELAQPKRTPVTDLLLQMHVRLHVLSHAQAAA